MSFCQRPRRGGGGRTGGRLGGTLGERWGFGGLMAAWWSTSSVAISNCLRSPRASALRCHAPNIEGSPTSSSNTVSIGSINSVAIIPSKFTRTPLSSKVRNHHVGKLGDTTSRSDAVELLLLLQRA